MVFLRRRNTREKNVNNAKRKEIINNKKVNRYKVSANKLVADESGNNKTSNVFFGQNLQEMV